ncbi:DinB family protein [Niabella beijingensis]|uniref:DinB family protein n=1 Tax=Niabella beijingensis TaxID=2872700 RepID=UPI001CBB965A|nr:DinB family protein [Niabella beijingensis]MBZ4190404.1 DinB family protein [Niabella beijingensis]
MKTTASKLQLVIPAYRMHSQQFNNAIDGISDTDALKRIEGRTNHIVWMAGNLVNCRYWLADVLGIPDKDPNEALFKDAKALDESLAYPSLTVLKEEWHRISRVLFEKLNTVTDEALEEPYKFDMGVSFIKENKLNMVGMCLGREDYLFGQIGLMRRILDYPGMRYDMDETINY